MANYKIKKYNGADSPIPELVEHANTLDTSTSLGFYSRGYDYGAPLNTNMLRLMEHFCSPSKPSNPVMGQIWFDDSNKTLSVYNGTAWSDVKFGTIIQKSLQWSGNFSQNNSGINSTILGTLTVTDSSYTCLFKPSLTTNTNNTLSDYIITGTIPSGLTLDVNVDTAYNSVSIKLLGTIPSSTPTFNFKIEFTANAFTNVMDISEVNNTSNTTVVSMTYTAPTTTTTAPTTTTTFAPTTTTTAAITTTTTAAAVQLGTYSSIKLGITWGGAVDLDTVVAAYDADGKCTAMSTITHPDVINGVTYGGDIRLGGTEEFYDIDLTQLTCTKLVLGVLEYTDNSFAIMTSLSTRIVDNITNTNIAQFTINPVVKTASNTANTTYIVGVFTKVGTSWTFASYQKLINSHDGKHAIMPGDSYVSLGL